ncbi:Uncharacterized protein APZ42_003273 [Daphnia magna]|uniref:Uncharacterized protein n=1 Tax=Daphnia magna TaxID=35525 RepID=A0A164HNL0_9CRUS|nr:Uncharacterized protein APZ42_003273 [Daphnia magna]
MILRSRKIFRKPEEDKPVPDKLVSDSRAFRKPRQLRPTLR